MIKIRVSRAEGIVKLNYAHVVKDIMMMEWMTFAKNALVMNVHLLIVVLNARII